MGDQSSSKRRLTFPVWQVLPLPAFLIANIFLQWFLLYIGATISLGVVAVIIYIAFWLYSNFYAPATGAAEARLGKEEAESVNVCIIGSGFSGICMAIKLREAGIDNFRVIEKQPELGGVWYCNQYPGARCDVWSALYQYSFYQNPNWTSAMAPAGEIHKYIKDAATRFGVSDRVSLNTRVKSAVWDESAAEWVIRLERNKSRESAPEEEVIRATHVVSACGALRKPKVPKFPGASRFKGTSFHSSRWDHSYDYRGKRLAIIGTGATAIQIVPAIVDDVKSLHVFQRSANWMLFRIDYNVPTWLRRLYRDLPFSMTAVRWWLFWSYEQISYPLTVEGPMNKAFAFCLSSLMRYQLGNDPDMCEKVIPKYELGCKRILFSLGEFLPLFVDRRRKVRPTLVTADVAEVTEDGITTKKGEHIPADLIVYCTGFDVEESICGFRVTGLNGANLRKQMFDDCGTAYLGVATPSFPNFFMLGGPYSLVSTHSSLLSAEFQVNYIMSCLSQSCRAGIRSIEVRQDVVRRFARRMDQLGSNKTFAAAGSCSSWFRDRSGNASHVWPSFLVHFWWVTRRAELLRDFIVETRSRIDA